ncbi:MAG TPA: cupin domain-containing protein [Epsilonproteobacteria bacterium]|nr:cupin domain-containing protein [Campylobacterota bacterium]
MHLSHLAHINETTVSHNEAIRKKVMVSNGEIPAITNFSRAVFPPGEIAFAHKHTDMTEIFYIVSGAGQMVLNDEVIELPAGACITVEPNETHELSNAGKTEMIVLYFGVVTP